MKTVVSPLICQNEMWCFMMGRGQESSKQYHTFIETESATGGIDSGHCTAVLSRMVMPQTMR